MKTLKFFFLLAATFVVGASNILAQPMGLEEYGAPKSEFPTPPNSDIATAIVSINLDYMTLNVGDNLLHTDTPTSIKIIANRELNTRNYTLRAYDPIDKRDFPMEIQKSGENPNCVFALVGSDWVNVICSSQYKYVKEHVKKPAPTAAPATTTTTQQPEAEEPKKGKKKKKHD